MKRFFVTALLVAGVSRAQDTSARHNKLFIASIATLGAASVADIVSSNKPHVYETNSLAADSQGRFRLDRGVELKAGMMGVVSVVEYFVIHRYPTLARPLSYLNFTVSTLPAYAAVHNSRMGGR